MWVLHAPYHPNLWRRCLMRPESAVTVARELPISKLLGFPQEPSPDLCVIGFQETSPIPMSWWWWTRWMSWWLLHLHISSGCGHCGNQWSFHEGILKIMCLTNLISDTCMNTSQNKEYRRKAYKGYFHGV